MCSIGVNQKRKYFVKRFFFFSGSVKNHLRHAAQRKHNCKCMTEFEWNAAEGIQKHLNLNGNWYIKKNQSVFRSYSQFFLQLSIEGVRTANFLDNLSNRNYKKIPLRIFWLQFKIKCVNLYQIFEFFTPQMRTYIRYDAMQADHCFSLFSSCFAAVQTAQREIAQVRAKYWIKILWVIKWFD